MQKIAVNFSPLTCFVNFPDYKQAIKATEKMLKEIGLQLTMQKSKIALQKRTILRNIT